MSATRLSLEHPLFAGRTGRGVRIAVVDSGVAPGHPHVGELAAGVSLVLSVGDTLDRIGHGTAVAAAIREKAPDAELVPVKVFDRALVTDARTLAEAIHWAADHACQIVNLSLGTSNAEHTALLEAAIAYATARGTRVVAAFESDAVRWLPGSLTGAIGVVGHADIEREELVAALHAPFDQSPVGASIYPRPIPGVPRERNLSGISFAVANATGFLARMLELRNDV
ncbi:MAG: S8 family serine peptidase [Gemmatimonadaceae bacterium]|nr:S8 family serine peptidase [Gemmatimonadaceae bacterium]